MNILIFLSALLVATSIADSHHSHHEECGGMLFKTSLADQKQMVGDIIRSINAPGFLEDKKTRLKEEVEKFVSKDVEYIWNYKKCDAMDFARFLPIGCGCDFNRCRCKGREALLTLMNRDLRAFPDLRISHDFAAGEGGRLMCQHEMSGTHLGAWCDSPNSCPPTGTWMGGQVVSTIYSFESNKIARIEDTGDFSRLMWSMMPHKQSQKTLGKAINRFNALVNDKDQSVFDKYYAPKVYVTCPFTKTTSVMTRAEFKAHHQKVVSAFPDLRCTIYSGSSDGKTSMTHSVCRGTNTGRLWDGSKATGRKVWTECVALTTLDSEGRVVKCETIVDVDDIVRQLKRQPKTEMMAAM